MGTAHDAKLDLFAGADDVNKVLLNRLLAVPELRARYLALCREIAAKWLDWEKLEPIVRKYQALIGDDVRRDTRKLFSSEAFSQAVTVEAESQAFGPFGGKTMGLKPFAQERKAYVLQYRDGDGTQAARERPSSQCEGSSPESRATGFEIAASTSPAAMANSAMVLKRSCMGRSP